MEIPSNLKIAYVQSADLKPTEYNPRSMTEPEKNQLKASITNFGFAEPIIVNSAENRFNIVIGGHQRLIVALEMGIENIPVLYFNIPEIEKEKELNLRLNRNTGHWEYEKLMAEFPREMLMSVGFTDMEVGEWTSNFPEIEKIAETSTGIEAVIKVICPAEKKGDIITLVQNAINGIENVRIE